MCKNGNMSVDCILWAKPTSNNVYISKIQNQIRGKMVEKNINKAFEASMANGRSHERKGDYSNALKSYSNAVKINTIDSNAHYCKSCMLNKLGYRKEAMAELDISIMLDQKNPMFRVIKGMFLVGLAIDKIVYDNQPSVAELGKIMDNVIDAASKEFDEALKLDPECAASYMAKWSMLSIFGKSPAEASQSLTKFEELIFKSPHDEKLHDKILGGVQMMREYMPGPQAPPEKTMRLIRRAMKADFN